MRALVIGCGRWGSFIAWYLERLGHEVTLYGRSGSVRLEEIARSRKNTWVTFSERLRLSSDIAETERQDYIFIAAPSQSLRGLIREIQPYIGEKPVILCMKGLEIGSGKRLSQVVLEENPTADVSVWLGPGHVQDFVSGIPNCMVIDGVNSKTKERLLKELSSDLIRFYRGDDLIGNEYGAASKNVIGIAAGMLDGLGLSSLKGALMTRATKELSILIENMGGNRISIYGLCHLGDYGATVFSEYSHNRKFGESFVRGEKYGALAEGYYTAAALNSLSKEYRISLPICEAVYNTLYHGKDPKDALDSLFGRSLKTEF